MKRKIFSVLFALVLLTGLSLIPAVPAAADGPSTWYVDGALGTDNATQGTGRGAEAFKTISYAVGMASDNDTIIVAAGTYDEAVILGQYKDCQGLTFLGAKAGVPAGVGKVPGSRGTDESIINGRFQTAHAKSSCDGVVIDGFTINGLAHEAVHVGYANYGTDGAIIRNNILTSEGKQALAFTFDSDGGTVLENDMSTTGPGKAAMYINPSSGHVVEYNVLHDSGAGLGTSSVSDTTIRYNNFNNLMDPQWGAAVAGDDFGTGVVVRYNNFENCLRGIVNFGGSSEVVDARFNWWGDSTGPKVCDWNDTNNNWVDGFADSTEMDEMTCSGALGNPLVYRSSASAVVPNYNPWLPGTWQTYYDPATGQEKDSDGDTFSDLEEYWLGTDPEDKEDHPGAAVAEVANVYAPEGETASTETTNAEVTADAAEGESASVNLVEYAEGEVPEEESVFGAVGTYVDVHTDDPENLEEVEIRVNYDEGSLEVPESSLRIYYWDSDVSDWRQCSDQGVNTDEDYIWAKIRSDTTPDLAYLAGGPFGGGSVSVELDSDWYKTGDTVSVTVEDTEQSGLIAAFAWSDTVHSEGRITFALFETETGIFEGSFDLVGTTPGAGELLVNDGDWIKVGYLHVVVTADVDDTAPEITIVSPGEDEITPDATPTISVTLIDVDSGINWDTAMMTLGTDQVEATRDGSTFSYTPSDNLSEGSHDVTVDVKDKAGNPATTASWSFTVDTVKPTVVIGLAPEPPYTAAANITFTLTFNEDMNTGVAPVVTFGKSDPFNEHEVTDGWTEGSLTEWVGTFEIDGDWTIDDDGLQTLKVSGAKDVAGNEMVADTSANFTIDLNAPGAPTLVSPKDEAIIEETAKPEFSWELVEDASGVTYQLQSDNNTDFSSPELDVSDLVEVTYTPTEALPNDDYSWRVRAIDGVDNAGEWSSVRTFTLNADTIDPEVTLVSPNGGEVWDGSSEQTISWTALDNITPDEDLSFTLLLSRGGAYDEEIGTGLTVAGGNITLEAGVFSYTWTVPGYNNDHCRIKVEAVDLQENFAFDVSDGYFTITTPAAFDIPLAAGWNLISLPVIPDSDNITEVISADTLTSVSNVISVQYYDPTKPEGEWLWYMPGVAESTLTTMEDGKGYWLYMADVDTLTVSGSAMPEPGEIPPTYTVVQGWNLIGFKSTVPLKHYEYLLSLDGAYSVLWGYDAITGYFNVYPLLERRGFMDPGRGYWLWATQDGIIVPVVRGPAP